MKIKDITMTALFAALICVCAPWSIPIGPVPISLASFAVYLAAAILGRKRGCAAVIVYVLLGAVGVPVFSGFSGGLQKLFSMTGGYIVGYIPCALITGLFADRSGKLWSCAAGMVLGTAALYALGTAWFIILAECTLGYALTVCVVPFLIGDAVKIVCASLLAAELRTVTGSLFAKP